LFGKVNNVKLTNDCVRVTCYSAKQKGLLLKHTDWYGKKVSVSEPWSKSRVRGQVTCYGVASFFRVSVELTEHEVAAEIQAETLRRLARWNGSGDLVKTGTMIIGFKEDVPEYVYIGCLRYKVKPYVPQPIRSRLWTHSFPLQASDTMCEVWQTSFYRAMSSQG